MGPRLLVITGTSGVGKTTITSKIAASLGIGKVASTDTIREVLRTQQSRKDSPALHRSSFEPAGRGAVSDWKETISAISMELTAVIKRSYMKGDDLLVEGVHLIPGGGVLDYWRSGGFRACGVVLYVSNEKLHRQMIAERDKHNGKLVGHYLDNFDRIREIQKEMLASAEDSGWIAMDITSQGVDIGLIGRNLE